MDKDLIRIIIFAIGLAVIIGMIVWSYLEHEKNKRNDADFGGLSPDSEHEHSELGHQDDENEELEADEETEPHHSEESLTESYSAQHDGKPAVAAAIKKPAIIQLSIVAKREAGFNGTELFDVLDDVGLEYGNLQIFERLDARRMVDFGVASMVKPGIFPSTNLAAFHCPGIVFFMQTGKLDNPVAVFDDFVRTFQFVASQLGGEMWDHYREPLTEETIMQLRQSLSS